MNGILINEKQVSWEHIDKAIKLELAHNPKKEIMNETDYGRLSQEATQWLYNQGMIDLNGKYTYEEVDVKGKKKKLIKTTQTFKDSISSMKHELEVKFGQYNVSRDHLIECIAKHKKAIPVKVMSMIEIRQDWINTYTKMKKHIADEPNCEICNKFRKNT